MAKYQIETTLLCYTVVEADSSIEAEEKYYELVEAGKLSPDHHVVKEEVAVIGTVVDSWPATPLLD